MSRLVTIDAEVYESLQQEVIQLRQEVSDRQRSQLQLEATVNKLKLFLEAMNAQCWEWDLKTNQILLPLLTIDVDVPIEMSFAAGLSLIYPEDQQGLEQAMYAAASGQQELNHEYRALHPNQPLRWYLSRGKVLTDQAGQPEKLLGIAIEITEYAQTKAALRESQEILHQLTEHIPDCFFIKTADGSRVFYISPAYETIWGQSPDTIYQNPAAWRDAILPEDRDRVLAAVQQGQGSCQIEYRIMRPDGAVRWISARTWLVPETDATEDWVVGLAQDVTLEKLAEQTLKQLEQKHQTIVDSIPGIVWEADPQTFQVKFINPYVEQMLGYPQSQWFEPDSWINHLHPEERQWLPPYQRLLIEQCRDASLEYRMIAADGRIVWLYDNVRVIVEDQRVVRLLGTVIDITERKQAEAALQQREALLNEVQAIGKVGGWELETDLIQQQIITWVWTDEMYRIHDLSQDMNQAPVLTSLESYLSFYPADVHPKLIAAFQSMFVAGESFDLELPFITAKQQHRWVRMTAKVTSRQADTVRLVGCLMDITQAKQAELDLRQLNEELEQRVDIRTAELRRRTEEVEALCCAFPDLVFRIAADGTYLELKTQNTEDLYGELQDLIGKRVQDVLPAPIGQNCYALIQRALQSQTLTSLEYSLVVSSREQYFEVRIVPLQADQVLAIVRNISDRKQAEESLRQSEARLQRVLQYMPVMLDAFDEAGNIIVWNQECERVTGYSAAEITNNSKALKWLYPNPAYRQQMMLTNAVRGNRYRNWEWELTCKDGTTRTIAWSNVSEQCPIPGWSNWAIGVDITERKQAERALRESEERVRRMFEDAPIGIAQCNLDGQFMRVNPALCQLLGYSEAELMELNCREISHPDDLKWADILKIPRIPSEILHIKAEKRYFKKNGEILWANVSISLTEDEHQQVLYGLAMVEDISERKRTQDALQLSRDLFEAVFQESADVIFLVDPETRLILNSNRRGVELFEANSKADLIGLPGHLLQVEPYTTEERDRIWSHLLEHGIWTMEREFQTYHGKRFWGNFAAKLIQVAGRQMNLVRISDISDRKRTERFLEQRIQQERLIKNISLQIRQSLELEQILSTTVTEVRELLQADRVLIFRLPANRVGHVIQESVGPGIPATIDMQFSDEHFPQECYTFYCQGSARIVQNALDDEWGECLSEFMQEIGVKSKIVAPIVQQVIDPDAEVGNPQATSSPSTSDLWGLLIAHACSEQRQWQASEVDLLQQLATQVGIAIQQADLYAQLKNELAQREILLKEIHHRVKNNLQVVSAMLGLQSELVQHPEIRNVLEDSENRLQAMALIHETLYQSNNLRQLNFSDYVQRLVSSILMLNNVRPENIRLTYQLESIALNLETAIPCGLLLNELVTNVIKHAFPDRRQGEIRIELKRTSRSAAQSAAKTDPTRTLVSRQFQSSGQLYILSVQDNGVGLPENFDLDNLKSLGLKIARDLAVQLRGRLELRTGHGTHFTLTFAELMYLKRF